jgi:DNA helicase-2/ATP-dependent DNA helicase PcrA
MTDALGNPALIAANDAWLQLEKCLNNGTSFIFEAGAGAGKTHSLTDALKHLVQIKGEELVRARQRVACITFTKVAAKQIENRAVEHEAIYWSTIHSFCWDLIKDFQPFLRKEVPNLSGWPERLKESAAIVAKAVLERNFKELIGSHFDASRLPELISNDLLRFSEVGSRQIEYSLGHPKAREHLISLHHDDVLALASKILENRKFRQVLTSRFPVIFIDEYQDTNVRFVEALKKHVIGNENTPQIGFFGDHWQKIYEDGCGKIEHSLLENIGKKANFRSVAAIVNCLNRIRPDLPQAVENPSAPGKVVIFHTNLWKGERRKGSHWAGDLPENDADLYFQHAFDHLVSDGWDFSPEFGKILMLTQNAVAKRQGYKDLLGCFKYRDAVIRKEDPLISFLVDVVEPACNAFQSKRYGEMLAILGKNRASIKSYSEKARWVGNLDKVVQSRVGTIGEVVDVILEVKCFDVPESVERKERQLKERVSPINSSEPDDIERLRMLRAVPYAQIVALKQYIEQRTPFSTKHGVKGAQFENVLTVMGRGWNDYNFVKFLETDPSKLTKEKFEDYERNRNLFYVACSRPKKRLALLFTQQLTGIAFEKINRWFSGAEIVALPERLPTQ